MSTSNQSPIIVYPHSISPHPSSNSKGSFGAVFVVLGVLAVLTGFACLVGQVCARRYLRPRPRRDHVAYHSGNAGDMEGGVLQMRNSASSAWPKGQVKLDKAKHGGETDQQGTTGSSDHSNPTFNGNGT